MAREPRTRPGIRNLRGGASVSVVAGLDAGTGPRSVAGDLGVSIVAGSHGRIALARDGGRTPSAASPAGVAARRGSFGLVRVLARLTQLG